MDDRFAKKEFPKLFCLISEKNSGQKQLKMQSKSEVNDHNSRKSSVIRAALFRRSDWQHKYFTESHFSANILKFTIETPGKGVKYV